MKTEKHQLLAAVIASHKSGRVAGRTRLQKTIKLLQSKGFESDYLFSIFHYGPYSDGVASDITLLENMGVISEELHSSENGRNYYVLASRGDFAELVKPYHPYIRLMEKTDATVLELAATYDAFREDDDDHSFALKRLKAKKGDKCTPTNLKGAMDLLAKLELPCGAI